MGTVHKYEPSLFISPVVIHVIVYIEPVSHEPEPVGLVTVDKVHPINQPVLLYYGILQLSSYYTNLFFNYTSMNEKISSLKGKKAKKIQNHGIGSY